MNILALIATLARSILAPVPGPRSRSRPRSRPWSHVPGPTRQGIALPYGLAIWLCHTALPYGFAIWHCHMANEAREQGANFGDFSRLTQKRFHLRNIGIETHDDSDKISI